MQTPRSSVPGGDTQRVPPKTGLFSCLQPHEGRTVVVQSWPCSDVLSRPESVLVALSLPLQCCSGLPSCPQLTCVFKKSPFISSGSSVFRGVALWSFVALGPLGPQGPAQFGVSGVSSRWGSSGASRNTRSCLRWPARSAQEVREVAAQHRPQEQGPE